MKMLVSWGSKPGDLRTSNFTPARRRMLRKKRRCGQSFFRGSTKTARRIRKTQTTAKWIPLTAQRMSARTVSQAFLIRLHPARREGFRESGTEGGELHRQSSHSRLFPNQIPRGECQRERREDDRYACQ